MRVSIAEFLQLLEDYQPYLPDEEDFEGVVAAILRLQDTYQLTSQQIADGTFTPTNRSPPMSGRYHDPKPLLSLLIILVEICAKLMNICK